LLTTDDEVQATFQQAEGSVFPVCFLRFAGFAPHRHRHQRFL